MKRIVIALLLLGLPVIAVAQQQAPPPVGTFWYDNTASPPIWRAASDAFPFPVNASVSATVGGFAPSLAYATCTATGSSCTSTALPTNTGSVVLFNSGTTTVSCTLASGAATALASELQIPASSGLPLATVYDATTYDHFACIDQSGLASNVVIASGGSGLPTGWGGGGGTGSSGAVFGPTANGSAAANPPVVIGGTATGGATGNVGNWKVDSSGTGYIDAVSAGNLLSAIANPINGLSGSAQSSSNPMGWVNINQTTPGTTNGVDPTTIARWGLMSGTTPGTAPTNTLITGGIHNSTVPTLTTGQTAPLQVGPHGGLLIGGAGYPIGSTPITISGTGTTGATTATLATGASVTTYICGFSIRANATAAATGNATVTGTITGTLNYTQWTAPNASGLGVAEQIFTPCIPASGTNQAIAVISAAPGTGGVVSVTAWGFTL